VTFHNQHDRPPCGADLGSITHEISSSWTIPG
jgi:hypothetical protein